MTGRQGGRPSSPRPRALWRTAIFYVAAAEMITAIAGFVFCIIVAAKSGIVVSAIIMIACAVVLNLTAGGGE